MNLRGHLAYNHLDAPREGKKQPGMPDRYTFQASLVFGAAERDRFYAAAEEKYKEVFGKDYGPKFRAAKNTGLIPLAEDKFPHRKASLEALQESLGGGELYGIGSHSQSRTTAEGCAANCFMSNGNRAVLFQQADGRYRHEPNRIASIRNGDEVTCQIDFWLREGKPIFTLMGLAWHGKGPVEFGEASGFDATGFEIDDSAEGLPL